MLEYIGFAAAIIAAIVYGCQFVPLKRIKNPDMFHFYTFMAIGIFMTSIVLGLALNFPFSINIFGLIGGLVWGIGNLFHMTVVNKIGIAKGSAIPLGAALVISFLVGTFFFNEPLALPLGVAGIALFLFGLPFVTYSPEKVKADNKWIMAAFATGAMFGSVLIFFKLGNLGTSEFIFPLSISVLFLGIALFVAKVRKIYKNQAASGITSGVLWTVGLLGSLYAVEYLGLAIGQPLTQFALVIGVLWGLFYFKETKDKKTKIKILIGSMLLFAAGALLTLSKIV